MKQYFIILLLMCALSAPSVYAEETAPVDDGTSTPEPVPAPKPEGEGKGEEEEEEEPDCE